MAGHKYHYDSIQFCSTCETAYTTAVIDKKLKLVCRNCGHEEETANIIVHRTLFDAEEVDKTALVNVNTKHDVSLPITTKKSCPKCDNHDAAFMRYKDSSMALMFICTVCDSVWKY